MSRRRTAESATGVPSTKAPATKKAQPTKKINELEKEITVKQEKVVWRTPEIEAVVDRYRIASAEALRQRRENPTVMQLGEDVPLSERVQAAQCPYLYFTKILKCLYSVHAEPLFIGETHIPKKVMDGLVDRAQEDLKKSELSSLSPDQVEHMKMIALGNIPFGLQICENDKEYQPETLPHNNAFDTMSADLVLPRWRNHFTCYKLLEPPEMIPPQPEAKTVEDEVINRMIDSALRNGMEVGELNGAIPLGRTAASKLKAEKVIDKLASSASRVVSQDMDEDEPADNLSYILPPSKDEDFGDDDDDGDDDVQILSEMLF